MISSTKHSLSGLPIARLAAILAFLTFLPLALLTYLSLSLATDAVRREVEAKLESTAVLSSEVVGQELGALTQLVDAYAGRPSLKRALTLNDARSARRKMAFHLRDLQRARPGLAVTFVARPDGRLIDIVPPTPAIVGKSYRFRDWYQGVTGTGRTYVSEAYRTQARSRELVTAAATLVRAANGKPIGILVAAYGLDHLASLSRSLAAAQGVTLKVTDQRGVLVATPGRSPARLVSRRSDPRVAQALRGGSGVLTVDAPEGRRLSAHVPVRRYGWTVTASVPSNSAFAAVGELRSTVLSIAGTLALLLFAGLVLLVLTLRGRQRAEEAARRQARINEAVLDSTLDGIRLADLEGNTLLSNRAYEQILSDLPEIPPETSPEERIALFAELVVDPQALLETVATIQADPDYSGTHDVELKTPQRSFRFYTTPVRDEDRSFLGRMTVVQDVTGEREAERLKTELLSTVSHELRTPLASVLGFAELLREREVDAETRDRYLGTIHSEAKRLTALINDFLDLQRIEQGGFTLFLESVELTEVLQTQVDLFTAQSAQHRLELELPGEPLAVLGERDRLAQVLGNLISNAIKYSPEGGPVRVEAERLNGSIRVAVRDEGLGIPADQQGKLFTKFFRVDTSDTREIGGTGLGLALTREIVEAHGGSIGFESTEGEGSTFWFKLPAVLPSEDGREAQGARRALVVEDDPAAAALLTEYLKEDGFGFDVEIATTGEEALASAREHPPALICLDLVLPGGDLDGWEVLARLKLNERTARVPVVICSAHDGDNRAGALGAADFLTKPFSAEQLRRAIVRVLPAGRGSVLVADDDPAVRRLVVETLRSEATELREAADGAEALREIHAHCPDALVLDLAMPEQDGFDVLESLQKSPDTRALPVIVLTGTRLSVEDRSYLRERGVDLLEKGSYSPVELRRLIRSALGEQPLDRVE
jgi:signal transduction histidine kinase/CheY-like chemotaxis protein